MFQSLPSIALAIAAALFAFPAMAQQAPAAFTGAPAAPSTTAPALPGVVASTNNPNLAVASLRLETGTRLSKIIGAAVYNDAIERVGTVDDLIMVGGDKVAMAVISVGGFLGLGSKLVIVPWPQLRMVNDKLRLPGVTKDSLNAMPNFTFD